MIGRSPSFEPERDRRSRLLFWAVILGFLLFWIGLSLFGAPRAAGMDVFVYKDPGCNLADGRGFTAWGMPGTPDLDRHLFASNGPAIPFLFGIAASVFGCTGRVNTLFELFFAGAAALGIAAVLLPMLSPRCRLAAAVLIGSALPSGLVFSEIDRPGVPAFAVFVLACLAARASRPALRYLAAPFAAGLCAVFFPLGGVLSGIAVWVIAAGAAPARWVSLVRLAVLQMLVFLVPVGATIALYAWLDPTAGGRFLGNALGSGSGAGAVLHHGYPGLLRDAMFGAGAYSMSLAGSFLLVAAILLVAALRHASRQLADLVLLAGLALFGLLTLLLFPKQNDYMAWCRTGMVVLLACSAAPLASRLRRGTLPFLLLAILCLANIPFVWMEALKQVETRDAYRAAAAEAAGFAAAVAAAPPGIVAAPASLYFIYRPLLPDVADFDVIRRLVRQPSDIAAVAACYHGSRDGRPVDEDVSPGHAYLPPLTLLSRAGAHYRPTLFGHPISRTEWGWSCDHYLTER